MKRRRRQNVKSPTDASLYLIYIPGQCCYYPYDGRVYEAVVQEIVPEHERVVINVTDTRWNNTRVLTIYGDPERNIPISRRIAHDRVRETIGREYIQAVQDFRHAEEDLEEIYRKFSELDEQ